MRTITMTEEQIDNLLYELNSQSYKAEAAFYSSFTGSQGNEETLSLMLTTLTEKYLAGIVNGYLANTISLLGRYRNTAVNEGDVVTLNADDFNQGQEAIVLNPALIFDIVIPVTAYSCEYRRLASLHFRDNDDILNIDGIMTIPFNQFLQDNVGIGIQARFWHVNQCLSQEALGNEEYSKTDFGREKLPEGRVIGDDER